MDISVEDDITAVLEMKKDFQTMLGGRSCRRPTLSFDKDYRSYSGHTSQPVSMQQLIDKEQMEKSKQIELIETRAQVTKLSSELSSLQTKHKQTCIQHDNQLTDIKLEQKSDRATLENWKKQMHLLLEKDENSRLKLKEARSELATSTTNYEQKIRDLQKEKRHLETDVQELQQDNYSKQQELRNNLMRKESELNICQIDLTGITEQLQHTRRRCTDLSDQLAEAEDERAQSIKTEQRVKDLEQELSAFEGERAITRTMKDQLDRLSSLETENRKLKVENNYCRSTQENIFLLREEGDSLKRKLERSEARCIEFVKLEMESKECKEKLAKWEALKDSRTKSLSPTELIRHITDLQNGNTSLLEQQGLQQSSIHSLERDLATKEQQLEDIQVKLSSSHHQKKEDEQFKLRLKRKLLLVSKERDSYKGIIESLEREHKVDSASEQKRTIQQLETTMEGYQRHILSLEMELERKAEELTRTSASSQMFERELNKSRQKRPLLVESDSIIIVQLREQIASMEKKIEEVLAEKEDMQLSLDRAHIQGAYEPEKTRVLTMTINPFSMARKRRREEIEKVLDDNKRLKTRIEVIEENKGDGGDVTQQVSQIIQQAELVDPQQIKEFQEKITTAELKNKRLMEVFKQKSNELREVVYRLLGYTIQLPCENQYKLRSVYAESPDDSLLFQQIEGGTLQLLETPYSLTLAEQIETYLTNSDSIPAFLCGLNMELFSRQTMMA